MTGPRHYPALVLSLASALLGSAALAQSTADVTRAIAGSSREIVAYLPYAEQLDIADALRVAALRGKRIYLVSSSEGVRDPQGFTLRLAHVPGVRTYLASSRGQAFVIVDGRTAFVGTGLIQDGAGTTLNTVAASPLLSWAQNVTRNAPVPKLDLMKLRYVKPTGR